MLKIRDCLRGLDIFGRPLHLNFDRQWNTHDTTFGGVLTGVMFVFTLIYTSILFNIMLTYS